MIRRLHELRHTEQVQRAYALNCGEGATVSYELQLRVLREFGLADGATELLQVGRKQSVFPGLGRKRSLEDEIYDFYFLPAESIQVLPR